MSPEETANYNGFIQQFDKTGGDRKSAVRASIKCAWQSYNRGDWPSAMRYFNIGWIDDPDNAEIFFGFALLMGDRGETEKAIRFYRKALFLNPQYEMAMTNLALEYMRKATRIGRGWFGSGKAEYLGYLAEAEDLLQSALHLAISDEKELSYIYYKWAVVLAMRTDYKDAWEKVHLSRKHGSEVEQSFIDQLSRDMPDPIAWLGP